jgi:hypothetical protein
MSPPSYPSAWLRPAAHHEVCLDGALSSTQNVVETLEVPLLKTKRIPASDAPNCEGSASVETGGNAAILDRR